MLVDMPLLGLFLWLTGYLASIALYFFLPSDILGWVLFVLFTPIGLFITYKRFRKRNEKVPYYLLVATTWVVIAVVFDYFFIVKGFNSQNYYKPDVLGYYAITFLMPIFVGVEFGRKRVERNGSNLDARTTIATHTK